MRLALIIGTLPDGRHAVVAPPSLPKTVSDHFKQILADEGRGFAEIQLWLSDAGLSKRKKFPAGDISQDPIENHPQLAWLTEKFGELPVNDDELAKLRDDFKVTANLLETAEAENAKLLLDRDSLKAQLDAISIPASAANSPATQEAASANPPAEVDSSASVAADHAADPDAVPDPSKKKR